MAPHLVLFDGHCGLCDGIVQFLLRHDRRRVFRFAPLQSPTGREIVRRAGGDPSVPSSFYVVAEFATGSEDPGLRTNVFTKSRAVLFVADQLGWPWRAAVVFRIVPNAVRDWFYDLVARSRYRVFGRYDKCVIPGPESRDRFVDLGS